MRKLKVSYASLGIISQRLADLSMTLTSACDGYSVKIKRISHSQCIITLDIDGEAWMSFKRHLKYSEFPMINETFRDTVYDITYDHPVKIAGGEKCT